MSFSARTALITFGIGVGLGLIALIIGFTPLTDSIPFLAHPPFSSDTREPVVAQPKYEYVEVTDGCGPHFENVCASAHASPSTTSPTVARLRNGIVLKVESITAADGDTWYHVLFDEWLRYPARVSADWYIASSSVRTFRDDGEELFVPGSATSTKRIIVDRSEQILSAYDDETLFIQEPISTGLDLTPTPRGTFVVYKKTPSRYMQGPLPGISAQYYDLPGVPWNLYFTEQGGVIHGAYWHNSFGQPWSHGCVNLPPAAAQKLYEWAEVGTSVLVQD